MPRKKKKINNLSFIATYLFEYPGSSASEVRRALWIYKNKDLNENFNTKHSYVSYFQMNEGRSHRGYVPRYWRKVNRCRWVLTAEGLFLVEKSLRRKTASIHKKIKKQKKKKAV